jgi:general secretion pathway protein G
MLVVIAIIALIASVLTPQLLGQLQLDTVASAVELFRTDVGRYPTQAEGLNALLEAPGDAEGWTGPYLKDGKITRDPWNRPITYQIDTTADRYTVSSFGSDGKQGGVSGARDLRSPAPITIEPLTK